MNLFFWRRSGLREFAEAIQPELRALATPEPEDALLQRIIASRDAGTRIILPEAPKSRAPAARRFVAVAIGAAILLVVVPVARQTAPRPDDLTSVSSFLGSAAFAQAGGGGDGPALPPAPLTRTGAMRPLVVELARRVRDSSGRITSELATTLTVAADQVEGTPAWRMTSVHRDAMAAQQRVSVETLYLARADLRMLRRAVHVTPYSRFQRINIRQHFQGDSVTGRMTTDGPSIGAGRPIARSLPPRFAPYLSDAIAPLFLMPAPLSAGWTGSASLLGWAVKPDDVFVPIELRVEGEERVRVPAGEFDCWRISIEFAGRKLSYWARKSDGLGVRMYDDSDVATRGIRELVLRSVR
jgi:hypothetical protein